MLPARDVRPPARPLRPRALLSFSPLQLIDEAQASRSGQPAPRMQRLADSAGVQLEDIGRFILEFSMMKNAAYKMANGESMESIKQSMLEEQTAGGASAPLNRQQRRMAKKKTKKKPKAAGGFGR